MDSLRKILAQKNPTPLVRGVQAATIIEETDRILANIFGASIKEVANASYIKNGTLAITCASSVAAQEIKLHEADILRQLHQKMSSLIVKKVRYIA